MTTIRPRSGDLEAAAHRHVPVPSGEHLSRGVERCDLCGLSWGSPLHVGASPVSGGIADPAGRQIVTQALLDEGLAPGGSIHSWRCEHPDRYGPCDCVEQVAAVVVDRLVGAGYGDLSALLDDLRLAVISAESIAVHEGPRSGAYVIARGIRAVLARYAPSDPTPKEQR